jgi:outer membrane protein, heavy metal efflux system
VITRFLGRPAFSPRHHARLPAFVRTNQLMPRIFLIFILVTASAAAQEVRLTLETAPAYALRHNPALTAARFRVDEARGRLKQSGRLANPELGLEFDRGTREPEGTLGLTLTQKFPVTARLRLEKAVSRAELSAAEAEVRNAERKLVAEVQTAVIRLLTLGSQREWREKQLGNSEELAGFTRRRVEAGEASSIDVSQIELEAGQLKTELLQLKVEQSALLGELRPTLGMAAGGDLIISGSLAGVTNVPGGRTTPHDRPDLEAAESTSEAARRTATLARAQRWEDLSFGFKVEGQRSEDVPVGFENDTFLGIRLGIPLPLWNRNDGRIQETAAAAKRAEKETEALASTIVAEARAARDAMRTLAAVVNELDGQLLPKAGQLEQELREAYSTGQTPLPDVLRARDRRLSLERQRIEALRDFHLARIRYRAATGQTSP